MYIKILRIYTRRRERGFTISTHRWEKQPTSDLDGSNQKELRKTQQQSRGV